MVDILKEMQEIFYRVKMKRVKIVTCFHFRWGDFEKRNAAIYLLVPSAVDDFCLLQG